MCEMRVKRVRLVETNQKRNIRGGQRGLFEMVLPGRYDRLAKFRQIDIGKLQLVDHITQADERP